jgi:hypothetical protein
MKITLDMVPNLLDGTLDIDSWTYRALRAQDEWDLNPGAPGDGFFKLVLTPMIRGLFNDSELDRPDQVGPARYQQGVEQLYRWTKNLTLGWSSLAERARVSDYPQLRRMLDRRRWYQELFRCKPGGFSRAWQQLASYSMTDSQVGGNSDIKTWFVLHRGRRQQL